MGTIEKAREYARNGMSLYMDTSDEQDIYCEDLIQAYLAGAKSEREELTRWHDPKEELPPIYDNVMVKYMALDGCEHVAIAWRSAGDAGGCTYTISGTGVAINSRNVIGWREIHE